MLSKKKVLSIVTSAVVAASLFLVGCGGAPANTSGGGDEGIKLVEEGFLTIGSDCDYPPFIAMDGEQPIGFEYELMAAISEELGLEVRYLAPQNFDTLLAAVASNATVDLGVSSFTITDERRETVNFCTPYSDSNQACVALSSKGYTSAADLEGMAVGAQSGTTGEQWARENVPGITMKTYNQTSEALAALVAGDIEAVFFDEPVASYQIANTYTNCEVVQRIATGEQYGIAVSKDNPALEQAVNDALVALEESGRFAEIFKKYFPDLEPPSLTPAS